MDISNKALIKDKCYINGNWIDSNNKDIIAKNETTRKRAKSKANY